MAEAFLALGGNLGDVSATLTRAVAMLCGDAAVTISRRVRPTIARRLGA